MTAPPAYPTTAPSTYRNAPSNTFSLSRCCFHQLNPVNSPPGASGRTCDDGTSSARSGPWATAFITPLRRKNSDRRRESRPHRRHRNRPRLTHSPGDATTTQTKALPATRTGPSLHQHHLHPRRRHQLHPQRRSTRCSAGWPATTPNDGTPDAAIPAPRPTRKGPTSCCSCTGGP